jgi:integrase
VPRDYGSGSIRRRPDGRWEGRLSLGTMAGKRQRKSVFGKSRREVILKLQREKRRHEQGLSSADASMPLGKFLVERWLRDVVEPNKRPWTVRDYRRHANHAVRALGAIPLDQLQAGVVQTFLNRVKREIGPSTAWHCRKALMAALNMAVRWRLIQENVTRWTDPVRVPDREPTIYDRRLCLRFLKALKGETLADLFVVSLTSGLRPSEVLALQPRDLDLEHGEVTIRRSLELDHSTGPTKSHRSKRPLPLSALALALLRQRSMTGSLVFATKNGTPHSERNVARAFKRILRHADLPDIRFYDLRHSFASMLESEHVPVKTLQELLGHARAETTLRYYTHGSMAANREAIDTLDRLLTPN